MENMKPLRRHGGPLIFGAAAWINFEAIHKLIKPQPIDTVGWAWV